LVCGIGVRFSSVPSIVEETQLHVSVVAIGETVADAGAAAKLAKLEVKLAAGEITLSAAAQAALKAFHGRTGRA
jgi:hypothetical protein